MGLSLVLGYHCDVFYEFSSTTVIYSVYMYREIRRPHCLRPEKRPKVLGVASAGKSWAEATVHIC